jgi:hypothetical protein
MEYFITAKLELVGGQIKRTPIAFIETEANVATFNSWSDWTAFVELNYDDLVNGSITVEDHFISNPICYEGGFRTTNLEGMNITIVETL